MIDKLADKLAFRLNAYTGNKHIAVDFVRYQISVYISVFIISSVSLVIGYVTSSFYETLAALLLLGIFRSLTGGFHLNLDVCTIVTILLITMIVHLDVGHVQVLNVLSIVLVILFGKSGKVGMTSVIMILINMIFPFQIAANCYFIQSLSLIPWKGGAKNHDVEKACGNG